MQSIQKSILIKLINDRPKSSPDYEGLKVIDITVNPINGSLDYYFHSTDLILEKEFVESFADEFEGKYSQLT